MIKHRVLFIGLSLACILGAGIYLGKDAMIDGLSGWSGDQGTMREASASSTRTALAKSCSFGISEVPHHGPVIMNEIAWMGSVASANDEWVELKNISPDAVDMRGWHLLDQDEKIKIVLGSGAKVPAGGLYLFARGNSDVAGEKVDMIYRGVLSNAGESLRLFDRDCRLIDEVIADSGWPAGNNAGKYTMERSSVTLTAGDSETLAWHTSALAGGTPKKENTHPVAQAALVQRPTTNANEATSSQSPPASTSLPVRSNVSHIVISQVQITGGTGKTDNDFIELYNPMGERFNLKGYRLVKRTQTGTSDTVLKSWTADTFIPTYGFYLWANSSFTEISARPDVTTAASIADDNGIAIRYGANNTGTIIDRVAWGKAQNAFVGGSAIPANPGGNQSVVRKGWQGACLSALFDVAIGNGCDTGNNASDFELAQASHPRNSQSHLTLSY